MKTLTLLCILTVIEYSFQLSFAPQKPLDFLTMRQIWPKTQCLDAEGRDQKLACTIDSKVTSWVIHGLWPNYFGNAWPANCDLSNKFDLNLISSLLDDLNEHWPNLYTDTELTAFWQHEWDKHGTCALLIKQINDQYDYFKVTLDLQRKYNYGEILERSGIVPSNTRSYSLSEISNAIEKELEYPPFISCFRGNDGKQYIYEIGICFNRDLEFISCQNPEGTVLQGKVVDNRVFELLAGSSCYTTIPVQIPLIHQ